jgi:hypothetical protein
MHPEEVCILSRKDYDKLDLAVGEVENAESTSRVGNHATLIATLSKLGYIVDLCLAQF